jgi:arsenate reductase (thioredoxin)
MAEAMLRKLGGSRFAVSSAGSNPAGFIHPLAVEAVVRMGMSTEGQYSKSWHDIAPEPQDIVITLCDAAACQPAPAWTGQPALAHWSLEDPGNAPGTPEERMEAADRVAAQLRGWIEQLIALPIGDLSHDRLQVELNRIPHGKTR